MSQPSRLSSVEIIQTIKVTILEGCGRTFCTEEHEHEAIRHVARYYDFEGNLFAKDDFWTAKP